MRIEIEKLFRSSLSLGERITHKLSAIFGGRTIEKQAALPESIQAYLPETYIIKPQVYHEKVEGRIRCFRLIDLKYLGEGPRLNDGPVDGEALLASINQIRSSKGSYISKNPRHTQRHY